MGCNAPECVFSDCSWLFDHVAVYPNIEGGTRIEWTVNSDPAFNLAADAEYVLQLGHGGTETADDWEDITEPQSDVVALIDPQQRLFGKSPTAYYRVGVFSGENLYYSRPIPLTGSLDLVDWRHLRVIMRNEFILLRAQTGVKGTLLRRRWYGERCEEPGCVDYLTDETRNSHCEVCYGTGIVGGYYEPVECVYGAIEPTHSWEQLGRGTVNQINTKGRFLASPLVMAQDIWIDDSTDFRYYIQAKQNIVEVKGVPAVCQVELRQAPFTDIIYSVPK